MTFCCVCTFFYLYSFISLQGCVQKLDGPGKTLIVYIKIVLVHAYMSIRDFLPIHN